jgi:alpha-N-arabinofuranosidase
MRKRTAWLALTAAVSAGAARPAPETPQQPARFDRFEYRGGDGGAVPAGSYRNPILPGFHPDPSVLRVGDDFYLVNSTFGWFPGIPVFHSRDLVHWRQIGSAIDRPSQLDFKRIGLSRGIFAPAISHHDGRFYIVTTCVDCGGNFVVTARDPRGPWSDPVWLPGVEGIDPSLFFDADGSAWIVNNRAPAGRPRYDGHRALWIERFDPVALRMLGNARMIVDGGVDPAARPVWIEGPHIFRAEGRYYLTAAEGGTGTDHSQVVFRADRVDGPYRPAPPSVNPILTQRDLDPRRPAPITSAGHADLVRLADGRWWATFLATRPYQGDLYNTGRETFLLPVTWRAGWPTILTRGQPIPVVVRAPDLPAGRAATPADGRDEFAGATLSAGWSTMRTPHQPAWRVAGGALLLTPGREGIGDHGQPAFVARRQTQPNASVTTRLIFVPGEGAEAGLAAVQDDDHFLGLGLTRRDGRLLVRGFARAAADEPAAGRTLAEAPLAAAAGTPMRLRIVANGGRYALDYAIADGRWRSLVPAADGTILSTARAGGFTGTMIGPFARAPR